MGQHLLNDKAAPLPVVRPLVLQPLSVSLDTANLLAVVVRHGVRNRVGRGVNTESTDSVKELFLFLLFRQPVSNAKLNVSGQGWHPPWQKTT